MKKIYLIIFVIAAFTACHSPKEKALENIKTLEANDSVFSPHAIEEVKTAYIDFANKYPDDELAPEFLFKAAQRCNATAQHQQALNLFQEIINKYPKHRMCEEALFLQGYVYENSLQDYPKAKQVYMQFIEKYPNSELADDAKYSMENLGKTPEEELKAILKKDSVNQ